MGDPQKNRRVVLTGHVLPGFEKPLVISALARIMKRDPDGIASIFAQHKRTPFKKLLTSDDAHQLTLRLGEIGVETEIETLAPQLELETQEQESARTAAQKICPKCGHLIEKLVHACPACGVVFAKLVHAQDDDHHDHDHDIGHGHHTDRDSDRGPSLAESVGDYIGPNAQHYLQKFRRFGSLANGSFSITWHWPAFLFGFLWALYRKLWFWGAFLLLGGTYTAYLAPPAAIVLWLTWALSANYIYYHHTTRRTREITIRHGLRASPHLIKEGGISRIGVVGGMVAMVALPITFQEFLLNRASVLMGRDVVVHIGTAQDNQPISPEAMSDLKVAAATLQMNLLVRDIDTWRERHPGEIASASLEDIAKDDQWNGQRLSDPWGSPYRLSSASGQLKLVSAGSDRRRNTSDDLHLPLP